MNSNDPNVRSMTRRSVLAMAAALPVIGAACGGGGTSGGTSGSPGGTAGGGGGGAPLNVGQISDSVAFFPLYIAEQKGFFTEEKVTLGERPRLGTGAKVAAALKSGSIDLGAGVLTDALNLSEVDDKAVMTTALVTEYYVDVVVGKSWAGPPTSAPVKDRINALVGKKIGITGPGSGTEALLTFLFSQIGKDANKDAVLVNLGSANTAAVGALQTNRVDALSFFQPIGQMVTGPGDGQIYISPQRGDIPELKGPLHGCVFSLSNLVSAKQAQVDGFNRAIGKSLAFIRSDAAGTKELLKKYLQNTPDNVVDALAEILPNEMAKNEKIQKSAYDVGLDFHVKTGLVKKAPSWDTFVPQNVRA